LSEEFEKVDLKKFPKTKEALEKAFAGESQARNKYAYFASIARKAGFEQVAGIFEETAENEKEHAKVFFKLLQQLGTTEENLKKASEGEKFEWGTLYPEFEKIAREEGWKEAATAFKEIAEVEKHHEKRYNALLENLEDGKVFKKDKKVFWKCRNCGHIHEGNSAPLECPACKHPQAFFELLADNF
jgi:rubrerythrin